MCEVLEKLHRVKEVKKEEVLAKDGKIKAPGTKIDQYEQELRVLKAVVDTDGEKFQQTANLFSETQTSLRNGQDRIKSYQGEVRGLKHLVTEWKSDHSAKSKEISDLKVKLLTLEIAQRRELIQVKAKNEGLQSINDSLRAANEKLDRELELWENGSVSSARAHEPSNKGALSGTIEESLASALKAANARADGLQISANDLQAENEVLQKQLQSPASPNPSASGVPSIRK